MPIVRTVLLSVVAVVVFGALFASADAEKRGWAMSQKANVGTLEKLKANGMQIITPSPQLKADMKKVGDQMLKEWLEKAGPEGQQLVDAYRKM